MSISDTTSHRSPNPLCYIELVIVQGFAVSREHADTIQQSLLDLRTVRVIIHEGGRCFGIPENLPIKGDDSHPETGLLLELFAKAVQRGLVLKRDVVGDKRRLRKEVIPQVADMTASHGVGNEDLNKDNRDKHQYRIEQEYPAEEALLHNSPST